jgi:multicomponent K+:H+ antiporter subunit G
MAWLSEVLVASLILIGAFFLLVGSFGLAKLPDIMRRLHAPTKATTLGIGSMLIASMLYFLLMKGTLSFHELMITIFLFLTAPVTAHMIAKAHILRDRALQKSLPPTGAAAGWATLDAKPESD